MHNFVSTLELEIYLILIYVSTGCLSLDYRKSQYYYFDHHPDRVYIPSQTEFNVNSFYPDQLLLFQILL